MRGMYNHYDDGKVNRARQMKSEIIEVTDKSVLTKKDWEYIKDCSFLYSQEQNVVLIGKLHISDLYIEEVKYVKTNSNKWFSIHYWSGLLDIDNSRTNELKEFYKDHSFELENDFYKK